MTNKSINWKYPIYIPLWVWTLFWGLSLIFAPNLLSAIFAGILVALPFFNPESHRPSDTGPKNGEGGNR